MYLVRCLVYVKSNVFDFIYTRDEKKKHILNYLNHEHFSFISPFFSTVLLFLTYFSYVPMFPRLNFFIAYSKTFYMYT